MTTTRVQTIRSAIPGNRPSGQAPGTLYTNWADNQLGVVNAASLPVDLLAVRVFSTSAVYVAGDHVVNGGVLYRAIAPNGPGAFNPVMWTTAVGSTIVTQITPEMFGAIGDGVTDDSAAIQAAINTNMPVYFSAKTYALTLSQTITVFPGPIPCALVMRSGTVLIGAGQNKTILKLKDNQSTDAAPRDFGVIVGNTILNDVRIEHLTIDVNGQNNKISPSRGSGTYNHFRCSAIRVGGTVAVGGVLAQMNRARIIDVGVVNCPGTVAVSLSANYAGEGNEVAYCYFSNNALDTDDHTTIEMYTNRSSIHHCLFTNPTPSTGVTGPVTAIEICGIGNKVTENNVARYCRFVWITGGLSGVQATANNVVSGNQVSVNERAILFNTTAPFTSGLLDTVITGNDIWIRDDPLTNPFFVDRAVCVVTSANGGSGINRVLFADNVCASFNTALTAYGVLIDDGSGTTISDVRVDGNTFSGFQLGIVVKGLAGATNTIIANNSIADCAVSTTIPVQTAGIMVNAGHYELTIVDNVIGIGDSGRVKPYWGVVLNNLGGGSLTALHMDGNKVDGSNAPINDAMLGSVKRSGQQARTFSVLPNNGTWQIGDVAFNKAPVLLGTSPNRYVVAGWTRLTNGSGNVLNTDWVINKALNDAP